MFKVSVPTKQQAVHGAERAVLAFVGVTATFWVKTPDPFSKSAVIGAVSAGAVAVYQLVLSTVTTL